jgi:hypothetical protein
MKQTLKEDLIARMRDNAVRATKERDRQWRYWFDNGGLLEAIRYPELGKPPSQRTADEIRAIVMREIERKRDETGYS